MWRSDRCSTDNRQLDEYLGCSWTFPGLSPFSLVYGSRSRDTSSRCFVRQVERNGVGIEMWRGESVRGRMWCVTRLTGMWTDLLVVETQRSARCSCLCDGDEQSSSVLHRAPSPAACCRSDEGVKELNPCRLVLTNDDISRERMSLSSSTRSVEYQSNIE